LANSPAGAHVQPELVEGFREGLKTHFEEPAVYCSCKSTPMIGYADRLARTKPVLRVFHAMVYRLRDAR